MVRSLCQRYLGILAQTRSGLVWVQVSGIMLVECIRWALPQSEAMAAAIGIADMSGDLVGSKLSHRTLQGILRFVLL